MVFSIQLIDNTKHEYEYFKSIPPNIYSQIEILKCNNNNLEDIDFIANFVNLKKLNASDNKIKTLPIISWWFTWCGRLCSECIIRMVAFKSVS